MNMRVLVSILKKKRKKYKNLLSIKLIILSL